MGLLRCHLLATVCVWPNLCLTLTWDLSKCMSRPTLTWVFSHMHIRTLFKPTSLYLLNMIWGSYTSYSTYLGSYAHIVNSWLHYPIMSPRLIYLLFPLHRVLILQARCIGRLDCFPIKYTYQVCVENLTILLIKPPIQIVGLCICITTNLSVLFRIYLRCTQHRGIMYPCA